jgi:Helicase conserved C-terminal domain
MSETTSPVDIRAELALMLASELVGPKAGPDEQVLFGTVRERYLGGMLAPRSTVGVSAERSDDPGHLDGDDAVEDPEGSAAAARPALFPSSFGLSCVVDGTVDRLLVSGAWGRYERTDVDGESPDGKSRRVWQRIPVEGSIEVALVVGQIAPATLAPTEHPGVELMGQVTRQGGAWLVSLFLVNAQESDKRDSSWLFQAQLSASAVEEDASVFVGRTHVLSADDFGVQSSEPELAEIDLLYRNRVEFAVGHGVAVHVDVDPTNPKRAYRIVTQSLPLTEVPRTEAPTADEDPVLGLAEFDMARLAVLSQSDLVASVQPIVDAYLNWLDEQRERLVAGVDGLTDHAIAAELNLMRAEEIAGRIQAGVDLLGSDPDAAEAFRFANEAMWQQRVRTTAIEVARGSQRPVGELLVEADVVRNRSWRPFQLAFVLVNLPSLTIPTHLERSADDALVDLLFFPTGGGKTEAYLGLTAYTLAIRRLQGVVEGHEGSGGVAVLMRYTLRLLTAQQFQRAAALICACEVIRRAKVQADPRWGATPYRIGLWVGSALTPNRSKDAQQALEEQREGKRVKGSQPIQITGCPWCGRAIGAGSDAHFDVDTWRTLIFCPDQFGTCPFTEIASGREGIPVVTVDEDLYRLLPDLVIATADKFAQLPLQGPLHMLFGRVSRKCTRHGYRSHDLDRYTDREERDSHKATRLHGPASTVSCLPLRPPDLIIQDELHLISGPLGTLVGLYETAVDDLASWTVNGQRVRPKVVASTATIRRAKEQTEALFWRGLAIFPPPVLDVEDSFFARQRPLSDKPGRMYLGVCAPGQRMVAAEIRVFFAVLAAGQTLYEKWGRAADPWMTAVGYFNALRELGGARRFIEDDVRSRLRRAELRGFKRRSRINIRELTSRVPSGEITGILDELSNRFDPEAAKDVAWPVDVVLATNMISVGVDVPRLGLMVAVGQPKTTAEYIQATSRVGRSDSGPGLVVTLYNWFRPRDLSHYETFEHYHATFYRHVEALSVTPFAARALDRGLTAVLVAMLRHRMGDNVGWNPNEGANTVPGAGDATVEAVLRHIADRAEGVTGLRDRSDQVMATLRRRMDEWETEKRVSAQGGAALGYRQSKTHKGLLQPPGMGEWQPWAVPNSLRETEPTMNLILRPDDQSILNQPSWVLGGGKKTPVTLTAEDVVEDDDSENDTDTVVDMGAAQ